MELYEAATEVLAFVATRPGCHSGEVVAHVADELGHEVNENGVSNILEWLRDAGLISGQPTMTDRWFNLRPTVAGNHLAVTGKTVRQWAEDKFSPAAAANVSNSLNIEQNYGNAAQGDYNHLSQTSIDPDALSGLLEVMRSHGDTETAGELESLQRSGDQAGFWKKLVERFSGKAVDAAAGQTVDYAAKALPLLAALLGGALGIPVG